MNKIFPKCPGCKQVMKSIDHLTIPTGITAFLCPYCTTCLGAQLLVTPAQGATKQ